MSFPCDRLCQSAVTQYVIPWLPHMSFLCLTKESLSTTDCRVKPDNDKGGGDNDRLSKFAEAMPDNDKGGAQQWQTWQNCRGRTLQCHFLLAPMCWPVTYRLCQSATKSGFIITRIFAPCAERLVNSAPRKLRQSSPGLSCLFLQAQVVFLQGGSILRLIRFRSIFC